MISCRKFRVVGFLFGCRRDGVVNRNGCNGFDLTQLDQSNVGLGWFYFSSVESRLSFLFTIVLCSVDEEVFGLRSAT